LFCKNCSIKENHPLLGFFSPKRYCKHCYGSSKGSTRPNTVNPLPDDDVQVTPKNEERKTLPASRIVRFKQFEFQKDNIKIYEKNPEDAYNILRKIGEGGSGSIFAVQNKTTHVNYALKRIPIKNQQQCNLILNEILITMTSQNENVVRYYESYNFNDFLWIIVELMRGALTDLVVDIQGDIPEELVAYICREILKGLNSLHSQYRIHRDIKSDNVLLGANGEIKLGDFGYAAQLTREQDTRITVVGTPSWMAPELALGDRYDEKVDLWALGIVAIEIAEGEPPNLRQNAMKTLFLIATGPPPTLKNPKKWSPEFKNFIEICLLKDPTQRPSATQLLSHPFINLATNNSQNNFKEFLSKWSSEKKSKIKTSSTT
jgi:serine/threonine protein kinase